MAGVNRIGGGLLVDPDRPISFTFEGRSYTGLAGDTIASALAANDQWLLSRSFKYHRPRGILTMAGQDANTLVQLDGQPNVHADRHPIADGLRVRAQNVTGSLEGDRGFVLNRLGRFLPVGFYYRAFFRPRGIWYRFWEPLIRKGAGLGSVDLTAEHAYYDKAFGHFDVAVIGGGPAGLSAALAAAETGAEVLLVDDAPMLGGSLTYARFDADGYLAAETRARLLAAIETEKRINVMSDAACNAWYADNWLAVIQGNRLWKVRAKRVVFATGAIEQPAVFRDNDLPGVMLGSAAQRLIRLYGVRPGTRAVVLAGNDAAYAVALDLAEAGVDVAAIADLRPHPPIEPLRAAAKDRGLTVLDGQAVREAVPATGHRHVRGIVIASTDGAERTIDCDVVCMSVGYTPAYHLPLQAGAKLGYDDETAMFSLDDLPDTVQLVGAVNGDFSLYASGERSTCVNHPWPIFPHPKGKEFVDFDEDLQVHDIRDAVADGYRELELVKRFSTVGMGPSQGRQSALTTARLVADATGRTVAHVGVTTARPPVFGEKLGVLAGRSFEAERRTPMHHRHLEAGAQMMPVGLWWRPSFYGAEADRDARIADEARNVRENVGLIDVSTLGGLDIRGPDAAEFLNRVYTFAYVKQPVGRARYVLMTNEAGSVIDDGVACRLSDDHFYVTATTGAAETVYLTMLWWNAQWRLDVDIANVTAAYAGVNVAGPRAREVVAPLIEDIDLSAEAFPYMGVRTGQVAGIPARVFRVGFVGELGYEIHVPASTGEALWDALIDAGRPAGLRPFGVEAQRVLRLEKGHVIVGQDTDAMTTPEELDMTWAIARKKPFFVGERSLRIRDRHLSARKLVGFTLPADGPCPQDSNLVLRDGTMAGFVTSVARSPVLNRIVGLAYTARDESQPGDPVRIHLDDGRDIVGEVVPLPFYDPDNARQENRTMATTDPASLPLRTPLWRVLAASGARFAEINGGAVADRYGDGSDEIKRFQRLGIADLTPLPRTGFKGAGAIDWLRSQGLFVPSTRNRTTGQLGGALVARLSDTEVLVLSDITGESDLVGKVDAAWPVGSGPRGWPLPRFDSHAWFWVGGTHAAAMFAKLCAVDLRPRAFAGDAVAQTSVARTTAIVIRADLGGILAYNLLCDRASAEYLWPVLLDAAEEFGGGPVGHAALVAQVR